MNKAGKYVLFTAVQLLVVIGFFNEAYARESDSGDRKHTTVSSVEKNIRTVVDKNEIAMEEAEAGFLDALFSYPLVVLFTIIALGLALGKVTVKGLSLGASGVLFVALVFGHMGYTIPKGVGSVGLVLFVFCIGITAGPSFFAAFARKGADLVKLSMIAVAAGAATTYGLAKLNGIPFDLASGLFAGALTSTPGLASATDALKGNTSMVSIGYGIAYPFGVIGVLLFIQLMPKLLGKDLTREAEQVKSESREADIIRVLIRITNPSLDNVPVSKEIPFFDQMECCLSREMVCDKLVPVKKDTCFGIGKTYLIVGNSEKMHFVIEHLGVEETEKEMIMDADNERMQIAVTSKGLTDKTLAELGPLKNYGVTVSRITRNDLTFVPNTAMQIEYGDLLTVVGSPVDLHEFSKIAGNKHKILHSTDIISLAVGISLGVILGKVPFKLPGIKAFTLGMAGGPLFVALVMGYFKRIGKLTTRIPMASKVLLMELGLLFFLANAGVKAGGKIVPVLREHGISLFFSGALITIVPMIIAFISATVIFKMNILEALGGICGGMTSTPALGAITAKVDSDVPVTSYATSYPVALILMTIVVQILITSLR